MTVLTQRDLDSHLHLGIDADILEMAGVRRLSDAEARHTGFTCKGAGDLSGIEYPRLDPRGGARVGGRLRRDHPEVEAQSGKPRNKYISAYGDNPHLYFPPGSETLLQDATVLVMFVEAEKSALAIASVARRTNRQVLAIATGGCWGWWGTVGKTTDADGARVSEQGPLGDFGLLALKARDVFIAFDSNAGTNRQVRAARQRLHDYLADAGAFVTIVDLPMEEGVNGPDDYIGKHGDDAFLRLLDTTESQESGGGSGSQAAEMVKLIKKSAELFHGPDGAAYVTTDQDGVKATFSVDSTTFEKWLSHQFYRRFGKTPTRNTLGDALRTLSGEACFDGPMVSVFIRVGHRPGEIFLDLGTPDWSAVEITAGGWTVIDAAPVKFRRSAGMLPLPSPERGGDIRELRPFLNIPDEDEFWLAVSWCLMALHPCGPYPVLVLVGEQGCAKSTTTRMLRRLIDPNHADIRSLPRSVQDLAIAANNGLVLAFDNLSGLTVEMSDALCRLATGGAFTTRTLYETSGETMLKATRPVVLNGIEQPASRPDLLDRAIALELPTISDVQRTTESEIDERFTAALPRILGALLDGVAMALRDFPLVNLRRLPRLADFARWTAAAAPAFGLTQTRILDAYNKNRYAAQAAALEGDPVGCEVMALLREHGRWRGTGASLLDELNARRRQRPGLVPHGWPTTPRGMSAALKRLAPLLRAEGVGVRGSREGNKGTRFIYLDLEGEETVSTVSIVSNRKDVRESGTRAADEAVFQVTAASATSSTPELPLFAVPDGADGADEDSGDDEDGEERL